MTGSSSANTSRTSSPTSNSLICTGMRPASMRVMSRISLMIVSRWRPFESMRSSCRHAGPGSVARHALQQHVRVAEDGIERRPELVRHVRQELRLEAGGLLELERLPPQQLVLGRQFGGRGLHRTCSSSEAAFSCS
jgi:hypothetical protein